MSPKVVAGRAPAALVNVDFDGFFSIKKILFTFLGKMATFEVLNGREPSNTFARSTLKRLRALGKIGGDIGQVQLKKKSV